MVRDSPLRDQRDTGECTGRHHSGEPDRSRYWRTAGTARDAGQPGTARSVRDRLLWQQWAQSTNSGTIQVTAGDLTILGGGLTNSGTIAGAAGRALTFTSTNGETFDDSTGTISDVDLTLNNTNATLDANVSVASLTGSNSTISLTGDLSTANTDVSLSGTSLNGPGRYAINVPGSTLYADRRHKFNVAVENNGKLVFSPLGSSAINRPLTTGPGSTIRASCIQWSAQPDGGQWVHKPRPDQAGLPRGRLGGTRQHFT